VRVSWQTGKQKERQALLPTLFQQPAAPNRGSGSEGVRYKRNGMGKRRFNLSLDLLFGSLPGNPGKRN
jgi:hypothetical protein